MSTTANKEEQSKITYDKGKSADEVNKQNKPADADQDDKSFLKDLDTKFPLSGGETDEDL
jgi:hypothetical protein